MREAVVVVGVLVVVGLAFDGESDGEGEVFTAGVLVVKLLVDGTGGVVATEAEVEGFGKAPEGEALGASGVVVVDEGAGVVV